MLADFVGLRVIWPPDGTRPRKHEHDVIFVHGLRHGAVTDWQDEDGVCWPAEHLSLDLGNARILAFGYDPRKVNVKSDGFYEGGLIFKQGEDLWSALKMMRMSDKIRVPITFVGHDTGGVVIKSALCISHSKREQFDFVLRKTRHVLLLGNLPKELSWQTWRKIFHGTPSEASRGQWKVWSIAHESSTKAFNQIATYMNVTYATVEYEELSRNLESDMLKTAHHTSVTCEEVDYVTMSKVARRNIIYKKLLACIRESGLSIMTEQDEINHIRSWLGRRLDDVNIDSHRRNLSKYHPGTGEWLFQDTRFCDWISSEKQRPILWLVGPGGCGKSVLCSLVAKRMQQNVQQQAVVYLMLAFDKPRSQYHLVTQIALQLLDYVIEHRGGVDAETLLILPKYYEEDKKATQVCELIKVLISQCPSVFVFVDGLDEVGVAEEPERRPHETINLESSKEQLHSVLSFLADLTTEEKVTRVRLWCSSKQTSVVNKWMRKMLAVLLPMNRNAGAVDIAQYLQHRCENLTSTPSFEPHNSKKIEVLRKIAKNNFLLASMLLDMMARSQLFVDPTSKGFILDAPKDASELYQRELDRILYSDSSPELLVKGQSKTLQIISIVAYAKRPLDLVELQEAIAVSQKSFQDVNSLNTPNGDIENLDGECIQRDCAPFISFRACRQGTKLGYLRLTHSSAFAFLHKLTRQPAYVTEEACISPNLISEACLKYVSQQRYNDATLDIVRTQSFYRYAAKHWHRHIDEADTDLSLLQAASHFMKSPQFLTLTRFQSVCLDRHFANRSSSLNIPNALGTKAGMSNLVDDYKKFIKEWSGYLQLGNEAIESGENIEQCLWGALGKQNFLQTQGSRIEANSSFLLEMDTVVTGSEGNETNLPLYHFHETINEDGTRVAVWKMPTLSKELRSTRDHSTLIRESWYIDGHNPPFRYGLQEFLSFDAHKCGWDSYASYANGKIPLIGNPDTLPQVPLIEECSYGAMVRIGSHVFYRAEGGVWTPDCTRNRINTPYWDSTVACGPWIVLSRRKQRFEHVGASDTGPEIKRSNEPVIPPPPPPPPKPYEVPNHETQSSSDKELTEDGHSDFMTQSDHPSGARSDSESEGSPMDVHDVPEESVSSAEEFCVDSSSGFELDQNYSSSEDGSRTSQKVDDGYESKNESEADSAFDHSDTTGCTSGSSVKHKYRPFSMAANVAHEIPAAEDSDADDEDSDADDEDSDADEQYSMSTRHKRSCTQQEARPKHWLIPLDCDLCSTHIGQYGYMSGGRKEDTFYQCSICTIDRTFDICSACFEKGFWCRDRNHLLSKCVFTLRTKQSSWEDGISQQTATPLVKILAGYERDDPYRERSSRITPSFRYTRRHHSMLHDSQPIIHPKVPLLVYPLDGRKFLFGDLSRNTYFTYNIPFQACETAETGGSACIPISVSLRFSSCGRYCHIMRVTARNDSIIGPIALHAVVLTIALCPKDVCSGRPTIFPFRQSNDLGTWPRMISRLPYTITWADSYVYLAMSNASLHVLRFPLYEGKPKVCDTEDMTSDICIFSLEVALPQSACSRTVTFFPAHDNLPAKIILGSLHSDEPQPPIVVYLKAEHASQWAPTGQQVQSTQVSARIHDNSLIEEPYLEDDKNLVPKTAQSEEIPTLEPVVPIRDQLLTGFQTIGIYCPSCFELGIKLNFLRPHSKIQLYHLNFVPTEDFTFKLEWRVSIPAFIEALQAGCQFCCYVACRMLRFHNTRHISQSIGRGGVCCCAEGSDAEEPQAIHEVIDNLSKIDWKAPPEERLLTFNCVPLNMNTETRHFDKIALTLPTLQVGGAFNNHKFAPIMVTMQRENELGETESLTGFFHDSKLSGQGVPECILELYSLPNDAAHHLVATRPLNTSRGKNENLGVIKSWLKDCQTTHTFCQQRANLNVELPTRLVEIVDLKTARLVVTAGQFGQYVALSYCWGPNPGQNRMTIRSNFKARLLPEGLPRNELPATIRDAVDVAERLGIRYIWVDALCMVQDDLHDKHEELGKMSRYYRNSFLTIAASTPSCTTGFVGTMGRCEKHPNSSLPRDLVPLNVFAHIPDSDRGESGKIFVREENPYQLHEEPINKRSWTLQECILAPRVLLFGSRVIWFCQHMAHSDGGVEDWSFDQHDLERTRREFQIELVKLDRQDLDAEMDSRSSNESRDIYDLWHRIIGAYSRRALTWPSDKLPAISAVAAEFSNILKDNYLAGLWRSNLPRDLLWTTPRAAPHRPKTWRAPTWSWASVDDAIIYTLPPPRSATLLADIVEAEAVPLTTMAAFGEIARSSLVLTAPSITIRRTDEEKRDNFSELWLKDFKFKPGDTEREMLYKSLKLSFKSSQRNAEGEKEDFQLPNEIFVVCIYGQLEELFHSNNEDQEDEAEQWNTWGLLLKKVTDGSGEQLFERVLSFSNIRLSTENPLASYQETFRII